MTEAYRVPGDDDLEALRDDRNRLQATQDMLDSLIALADECRDKGHDPPMTKGEEAGLRSTRHLIHLMLLERNSRCANLIKKMFPVVPLTG